MLHVALRHLNLDLSQRGRAKPGLRRLQPVGAWRQVWKCIVCRLISDLGVAGAGSQIFQLDSRPGNYGTAAVRHRARDQSGRSSLGVKGTYCCQEYAERNEEAM